MPNTGINVLPKRADRTGLPIGRPSWRPLRYAAAVLSAVAIVAACTVALGWARIGVTLIVIELGIVLVVGVACIVVPMVTLAAPRCGRAKRECGKTRSRAGHPAASLAFDAAPRGERLAVFGSALVGPNRDGRDVLSDADASTQEVVARGRSDELGRTWAWLACVGGRWQRVETVSDDGTVLVGHVIAPTGACAVRAGKAPRWLLFCHGYGGDWREGLVFARAFAAHGYGVLLCDMRAHGESGGRWRGLGVLDRRDVVAWAAWLERWSRRCSDASALAFSSQPGVATAPALCSPPDTSRAPTCDIVLMGHSMGAASVLMASAEPDLSASVRAVVADCGYADVWSVVATIMRHGMHIPPHPLLDAIRGAFSLRKGGYDIADAAPVRAVEHARVPVLVIHGDCDTFVPPVIAPALDAAAGRSGQEHRLVMMPGAGHCQAVFANPSTYYKEVFGFLNECAL